MQEMSRDSSPKLHGTSTSSHAPSHFMDTTSGLSLRLVTGCAIGRSSQDRNNLICIRVMGHISWFGKENITCHASVKIHARVTDWFEVHTVQTRFLFLFLPRRKNIYHAIRLLGTWCALSLKDAGWGPPANHTRRPATIQIKSPSPPFVKIILLNYKVYNLLFKYSVQVSNYLSVWLGRLAFQAKLDGPLEYKEQLCIDVKGGYILWINTMCF